MFHFSTGLSGRQSYCPKPGNKNHIITGNNLSGKVTVPFPQHSFNTIALYGIAELFTDNKTDAAFIQLVFTIIEDYTARRQRLSCLENPPEI